jgi:GT2 family glycosyltransferase
MAPVGIIIITYNSVAEIGACLDALHDVEADVVVIDNASRDETVDQVRRRGVRLIANPENRGFAAAANQGFAELMNPYILLLNPDSVLVSGLEPLREACDLPGSVGAGGKLLDEKGQQQAGFMARQLPVPGTLVLEALVLNRMLPGNPVNRRYRLIGQDYSKRFAVEQPAGAFLMVRRSAWQELGGFDEGFYPLWFEDVDFCRRIRDRGWLLYYVPEAVAKHTGGHSIPRLPVEMRRVYWYRSLLRYSAKHFSRRACRVVCASVALGSLLRGATEMVSGRRIQAAAGYGRVIRMAVGDLFGGCRS